MFLSIRKLPPNNPCLKISQTKKGKAAKIAAS